LDAAAVRWILAWYAVMIAMRELWRRSVRWSPEQRTGAILLFGGLMGITFAPFTIVSELWWLLTGGGPVRWLGLKRYPNVNPFPPLPREVFDVGAIGRLADP